VTASAAGASLADQAARLSARADQVALCLDFDGTLSPIVDDPEAARPLAGVVELLGPLAHRHAAVALISGRPADFLATHASAPGVRYLGLYAAAQVAAAGGDGLRVAVRSAEAPPELLDQADLVVDGPPGLRELLERLAAPPDAS
jgi:trehalose 6-phosphate phosphatase